MLFQCYYIVFFFFLMGSSEFCFDPLIRFYLKVMGVFKIGPRHFRFYSFSNDYEIESISLI